MKNIIPMSAALIGCAVMAAQPATAAHAVAYAYDTKGRLVQTVRSGGGAATTTTTYAHDRVNNRTSRVTS